MIKIWDEELTQIRLRELQDKGVAVEIVGEGDLLQITEGWIHFGEPVCNYQIAGYTKSEHSESREASLLKQIESLKKEVAMYADAAYGINDKKLEDAQLLWAWNGVSLFKCKDIYSITVAHGPNRVVKTLSRDRLASLKTVITKELEHEDS